MSSEQGQRLLCDFEKSQIMVERSHQRFILRQPLDVELINVPPSILFIESCTSTASEERMYLFYALAPGTFDIVFTSADKCKPHSVTVTVCRKYQR